MPYFILLQMLLATSCSCVVCFDNSSTFQTCDQLIYIYKFNHTVICGLQQSNFLTEFVKKRVKFSKRGVLTGSQVLAGGDFFQGGAYGPSLPIIEVSSWSPESKNVDGNLSFFINISGLPWQFFPNFIRKSAGSKDLTFPLFTM